MEHLCQTILQSINHFDSAKYLPSLMNQVGTYRIGNKILHEILAIEFVKNINKYTLKEKTDILL